MTSNDNACLRVTTGRLLAAAALLTLACARPQAPPAGSHPPATQPATSALSPGVSEVRRARLDRAMAGLIFAEGRVTVAQPLVQSVDDVVAAQEAVRLGEELLARGRRVEAVAAFTRAVVAAPSTASPFIGLARALAAKGRVRQARAAVRTALANEPTAVEAHFLWGSLAERLGIRSAAISAYERVLELAPTHGRAHGRLAVLRYLSADPRAAAEHAAAARATGTQVATRLPGLLAGREMPAVALRPLGRGVGPSVGPEVRIDVGAGDAQCNEISAAASAFAGGEVVAAWNDFRNEVRLGVGMSLDHGATWTDTIVRPPAGNQSALEGDPMSAVDPRTGTLWVGGLSFLDGGGVFVARKPPGAATFEPSVMAFEGAADKPWMTAGRPPATPDATQLYVAFNQGLLTSSDLGQTWGPLVALEPGIGYLPRVGPLGELHVANSDFQAVRLQTSLDGGATVGPLVVAATRLEPYDPFETAQIPGLFRAPAFNILAIDPVTGRLTFVWFDTTSVSGGETDVDLYFAHSQDGSTWTLPAVLPLPGDQFLPWLEIDSAGRLHLVFFDTRHTAQSDSDSVAWIDAYYAYSEDGGASWSEIRLTDTPWSSALAGPFDQGFGEQFLGDYLGLAVADNRVFPIYLSTQDGDADLFTRAIRFAPPLVFADGFESGDLTGWE
ncbi:MAG: hypothetical protein AAF657_06710 [Acidobacteriota bacterium]